MDKIPTLTSVHHHPLATATQLALLKLTFRMCNFTAPSILKYVNALVKLQRWRVVQINRARPYTRPYDFSRAMRCSPSSVMGRVSKLNFRCDRTESCPWCWAREYVTPIWEQMARATHAHPELKLSYFTKKMTFDYSVPVDVVREEVSTYLSMYVNREKRKGVHLGFAMAPIDFGLEGWTVVAKHLTLGERVLGDKEIDPTKIMEVSKAVGRLMYYPPGRLLGPIERMIELRECKNKLKSLRRFGSAWQDYKDDLGAVEAQGGAGIASSLGDGLPLF